MNDNRIGNSGASAIAEGLKVNSTLTEIDLRLTNLQLGIMVSWSFTDCFLKKSNLISDSGASAIAEGLKINSNLTGIDLSGIINVIVNNIHDY